MDRSKFEATLERAQQLMNNPEFGVLVEESADMYNGKRISHKKTSSMNEEINQMRNGGLDNIRESFRKQPGIEYEDSVLNEVTKKRIAPQTQQQVATYTQQYVSQPTIGGVDYNYLKYIINECIKENLAQIKQTLNESQVKTVGISGDKIQFLDKAGNLYEGTLSFTRNVKKK